MNPAPLIQVTPTLAPPSSKQKKKHQDEDEAPWPPGMDSNQAGTGNGRVKYQNSQDVSEKTFGSKDTCTTTTSALTECWGVDSFDSLRWEDLQVTSQPSGLSATSQSKRDDSNSSNFTNKMLQDMMKMSIVKDVRVEEQDMVTEWPAATDGNVATEESKPRRKSSSKQKKEKKRTEKTTSGKKSSQKITSEVCSVSSVSPTEKDEKVFTTPFEPAMSPPVSAKNPKKRSSRVDFDVPPIPLPLDSRSDDGMSQQTTKNTNSSSSRQNRKVGLTAHTSMPIIASKDDSATSFTQMTPRTRRSRMLGKHPSMSLVTDGHGPSLHSVFCWGGDKPAKHDDLPSGAFVVTSLVEKKRGSMVKNKPAPLQPVSSTPHWPSKKLSNRSLHAQFYERTMGQTPQVESKEVSTGITAAQLLNIMEPCSVREVLTFSGFQGGFDDSSEHKMNYSDILDNKSVADSVDGSEDGSRGGSVPVHLIGKRFVPPPRPNTDLYGPNRMDSA